MNNKNNANLISLHKIEKRLFDINDSRGGLPKQIGVLKEKNNDLTQKNNDYEKRLLEIDKRKIILDADISDTSKKIDTLNEQMYKVKSNKEYEALLNEIDHLNGENDKNLDELGASEEEVGSINLSIKKNNEDIELLNKELLNKEKNLGETNLLIEKEEKKLTKDKELLVKNLSSNKSLFTIYNDKKEEYDGLAFAEINRNCCENCYSGLPPQLIIDAKNQDQLVSCPSCRILLYIDAKDLINEE